MLSVIGFGVILFMLLCLIFPFLNVKKRMSVKKEGENLIAVAFSRFTEAQLKRWLNVAKLKPKYYTIIFVTEVCEYVDILKPLKVFCFTRKDFAKNFPEYYNMLGYCRNQPIKFYMWSMWLDTVLFSIKHIYNKYKYIWIMEGDVAYSGNFFNFFIKYDNDNYSDLLSQNKKAMHNTSEWPWYECYNNEYKEWIKSKNPTERLAAFINILRMSSTLFKHIMINYKLKRRSHCESTLNEVAKYNNLIVSFFNKSDIDEKLDMGVKISESEWKMCNTDPLKQNKIYHPLKF